MPAFFNAIEAAYCRLLSCGICCWFKSSQLHLGWKMLGFCFTSSRCSTSLLLRLSRPEDRPLKYVKTMMAALLTWMSWHDVSPGIIHCEESCEALLSKVVRELKAHPHRTDHEHYADVYLATSQATTANKHSVFVQERVLQAIKDRLLYVMQNNESPPPVKWHSGKPRRAKVHQGMNHIRDRGPRPVL